MNNKKSKKLRGINRKIRQGLNNLRKRLCAFDRSVVIVTGAQTLEWLSECLDNEVNKNFDWYIQDSNESVKDV